MIIRIAGEGQYRFPNTALDDLNTIDNGIVEAVARDDNSAFRQGLTALLEMVRSKGQPLQAEEIADSDLVLPFPDLTLDEARDLFVADGLIPG